MWLLLERNLDYWVQKHMSRLMQKELGKIANLFNRDGGPTPPVGISVPQAMYDDFVEVCKPVKEIRADYPFEVKVAKPFKRPTQSGGTDASVFAVEGVPTFGFNTQDIKRI